MRVLDPMRPEPPLYPKPALPDRPLGPLPPKPAIAAKPPLPIPSAPAGVPPSSSSAERVQLRALSHEGRPAETTTQVTPTLGKTHSFTVEDMQTEKC